LQLLKLLGTKTGTGASLVDSAVNPLLIETFLRA
jgi:hypothetical protein